MNGIGCTIAEMETRLVASTSSGAATVLWLQDSESPVSSQTRAAGAIWPAWRPRHGTLSWSEADDRTLMVVDGKEVPGASHQPARFIGPGLPHYPLWSPDGRALAYVVPDGQSLNLRVWTVGEPDARELVSGAPIFSSWLPGGDALVVHHGASLRIFETSSVSSPTTLSESAAGFRAPAVSGDGSRIAWAEVRSGAVHVMECDVETRAVRELRVLPAGVALCYAADGRLLAASSASPESPAFASIVDVERGASLIRSVMTAFWLSPDVTKLVTLHPSFTGDGRYQAKLWDHAGRALGATEAFVPSAQFGMVTNFFDQFSLSHPLWSADSRWFGLPGRFPTDSPHPAFSDGVQDYVWLWDTVHGVVHRRVAPGSMLTFER